MSSRFLFGVLLAILVATLTACNPPTLSVVTVKVLASEYKFELDPPLKEFSVGTTYHFIVANRGKFRHEWMILPQDEMDHSKALASINADDLKPDVSVSRDVTFKHAGNFEFACHVDGHYDPPNNMWYRFTVK
ncbi:hypothetical protein HY230_09840 [Candidatus Acetothermia bacterium]|nr:hypothetical protein [Candidatus Acetothermia bacterium]